jgi:hypothetical protein
MFPNVGTGRRKEVKRVRFLWAGRWAPARFLLREANMKYLLFIFIGSLSVLCLHAQGSHAQGAGPQGSHAQGGDPQGSQGGGPQGYWRSDDNKGFFEGLESVEMRVDRSGNTLSGNVYYIWEHGIYFQDISLEGNTLGGDSSELKETGLVANRNGNFPGDCRGIFHLHYSKDKNKEYLTGVWKKPPGAKERCPDTRVTFYRAIHSETPGPAPLTGEGPRTGVLPVATPASAPAPNPDSLRLVMFKTRKDSLELVVPHHADTARLEFYDNGIVDHDRISLFLGDSLVLKNYELLAEPRIMRIDLNKNKIENVLSLYAENEGDIPPNTALMVIYVDDQRYEVRLSSDMKTNARVIFKKLP